MSSDIIKNKNVDCDRIIRSGLVEKLVGIEEMSIYAYEDSYGDINIIGQIFAKKIRREFELNCVVYDKDGDILLTTENFTYGGAGLVSNTISDECFFQGFPFKFSFQRPKTPIGVIAIIPV